MSGGGVSKLCGPIDWLILGFLEGSPVLRHPYLTAACFAEHSAVKLYVGEFGGGTQKGQSKRQENRTDQSVDEFQPVGFSA